MNKIRIRQNYENYERVQKAFKEFIHALVWESMDIDGGAQEEEINEHIDKYCITNGSQMIALANDSITKFIKSLELHYSVHCYELGANSKVQNVNLDTNNLSVALRKAAEFYRIAKSPKVTIYDNEADKYIAELQ